MQINLSRKYLPAIWLKLIILNTKLTLLNQQFFQSFLLIIFTLKAMIENLKKSFFIFTNFLMPSLGS